MESYLRGIIEIWTVGADQMKHLFFFSPILIFLTLNTQHLGAGGWSPLDTDRYQWLQVDLGSRKQVVSIATQGRYRSYDWTSQYQLLYSDTPNNWRPYLKDGNIWVRYIFTFLFAEQFSATSVISTV